MITINFQIERVFFLARLYYLRGTYVDNLKENLIIDDDTLSSDDITSFFISLTV